jgi:hypothetical protein
VLAIVSLQAGGGMLLFIALFGGFTCWQRYQAARQGWIVEDPVFTATYERRGARGGFWRRLFKLKPRRRDDDGEPARRGGATANPNPGAWEARQAEREAEEVELDRILKKVHDSGINSLSYVERQRLEYIRRKRRREEAEVERRF